MRKRNKILPLPHMTDDKVVSKLYRKTFSQKYD